MSGWILPAVLGTLGAIAGTFAEPGGGTAAGADAGAAAGGAAAGGAAGAGAGAAGGAALGAGAGAGLGAAGGGVAGAGMGTAGGAALGTGGLMGADIAGSGALFGPVAGMGGATMGTGIGTGAGMGAGGLLGSAPYAAQFGGSTMAYPFSMTSGNNLNPMMMRMGASLINQSQQQQQQAPGMVAQPHAFGNAPVRNPQLSQPMPYAQIGSQQSQSMAPWMGYPYV